MTSNSFLPLPWYPTVSYLNRDIHWVPTSTVISNGFLPLPCYSTVSYLYRDIQRFPAYTVISNGFLLLPWYISNGFLPLPWHSTVSCFYRVPARCLHQKARTRTCVLPEFIFNNSKIIESLAIRHFNLNLIAELKASKDLWFNSLIFINIDLFYICMFISNYVNLFTSKYGCNVT